MLARKVDVSKNIEQQLPDGMNGCRHALKLPDAPEYLHRGSLTAVDCQLNSILVTAAIDGRTYLEQLGEPDGQSRRHHLDYLRCARALCIAKGAQ